LKFIKKASEKKISKVHNKKNFTSKTNKPINFLEKTHKLKLNKNKNIKNYFTELKLNGGNTYDINKNLKLTISQDDFFFEFTSEPTNSLSSQTYTFKVFHAYYLSYDGYNSNLRPMNSNPGGAYILSTTSLEYNVFKVDYDKSYYENGSNVSKIVLRFEKSYLILTIANEGDFINNFQMESIWDPIDKNDSNPKEYLLVVKSDIDNSITLPDGKVQPEFWTDSNGIKMMRRIKDFRASYKYTVTEKLGSNFYPVNSMMSMFERKKANYNVEDYKDIDYSSRKLTLLNDRAQSGGAMENGEFIMIHNRHSNWDDRRGLADGIYENSSFNINFRVNNYLIFGNNDENIKNVENSIQERFNLFVWDGDRELQINKSNSFNK